MITIFLLLVICNLFKHCFNTSLANDNVRCVWMIIAGAIWRGDDVELSRLAGWNHPCFDSLCCLNMLKSLVIKHYNWTFPIKWTCYTMGEINYKLDMSRCHAWLPKGDSCKVQRSGYDIKKYHLNYHHVHVLLHTCFFPFLAMGQNPKQKKLKPLVNIMWSREAAEAWWPHLFGGESCDLMWSVFSIIVLQNLVGTSLALPH